MKIFKKIRTFFNTWKEQREIKKEQRRNKRNERERQEKQVETIETQEELKDKLITMYFENEEEMELFIKRYKLKNFEYFSEERTIKFPYSELMKEDKEK